MCILNYISINDWWHNINNRGGSCEIIGSIGTYLIICTYDLFASMRYLVNRNYNHLINRRNVKYFRLRYLTCRRPAYLWMCLSRTLKIFSLEKVPNGLVNGSTLIGITPAAWRLRWWSTPVLCVTDRIQ